MSRLEIVCPRRIERNVFKTIARGFRRFENFRIGIRFFLGGLDLNPRKCL
jgi:hypothetical protein